MLRHGTIRIPKSDRVNRTSLAEQIIEVLSGEAPDGAAGIQGRGGKPALFILQLDDPFFDRVSGDQFIDKDGLCLADPVGSVGRPMLAGALDRAG